MKHDPIPFSSGWQRSKRLLGLLLLVAIFAILLFAGCTTTSSTHKINALKLGMSKQQVVSIMGEPVYTSAQERWESLHYNLTSPDDAWSLWGASREYYVRLLDGKVQSFGRR